MKYVRERKYIFTIMAFVMRLLSNFNLLNQCTDMGSLWGNFLINERIKTLSINRVQQVNVFGETIQQQEIDCIEMIET